MSRTRSNAVSRHSCASVVRLSAMHRTSLYAIAALLLVSGALWLIFHHFIVVRGALGPVRHPLEPWFLRIHGAAAMAFLVVFGTMLPVHVRRAWDLRRNRGSGIAMFAFIAWLIATGWGLYYFGDESLRAAASIAHWTVGFAVAAVLAMHIATRGHKTAQWSAPVQNRDGRARHGHQAR